MTAMILVVIALAAPPESQAGAGNQVASTPRSVVMPVRVPERTLQHWRDSVQQALKAQSGANETEQAAATMRLVTIYRELLASGPLNSGEEKRLQSLVRARLLRVRDEVGQDLRLRAAHVKAADNHYREKPGPMPAKIEQDRAVLAQWRGALAQFGGPVGGGGAANQNDDGEELIDLIQAVITPDFWDKNGGPGSIVYFQGLHILAVQATTEKHEQIADLLDALRRAGN